MSVYYFIFLPEKYCIWLLRCHLIHKIGCPPVLTHNYYILILIYNSHLSLITKNFNINIFFLIWSSLNPFTSEGVIMEENRCLQKFITSIISVGSEVLIFSTLSVLIIPLTDSMSLHACRACLIKERAHLDHDGRMDGGLLSFSITSTLN